MHLQNVGAAEYHSMEKKGKIFPTAEIPLAGEWDWLAQLESDHLLQSLVLFLHTGNSFELILQAGLGPFLLWDRFTAFLAIPFLQVTCVF